MRSVWPKIMTWGYRSLHNGIRALTHSKSVCPTRENTCAHKMGGLWMTKGRRNLGLPHCLGKEKGKALYVGSLFKISWDFFPWGCVTWKRTKSCDLCFQSGKYHDMRIWVVQEWYQSTAPPRKCGPHMHPHVRLYGGGLWRNKRRRNLGVLHCQRKEKNEKGRGLYMLAHYIKCHKLFSHEIVSREEEQNCITCADNIMTWGYRSLHNEKQSWSLTSPGEGKREGLIYGLTIKNVMRPFPTRLCHVRKNKTKQPAWPKWTISLHEDMGHYRMRSNLGVLYFLRKERERPLYMGSLSKMSWSLFPLGCVSREGE